MLNGRGLLRGRRYVEDVEGREMLKGRGMLSRGEMVKGRKMLSRGEMLKGKGMLKGRGCREDIEGKGDVKMKGDGQTSSWGMGARSSSIVMPCWCHIVGICCCCMSSSHCCCVLAIACHHCMSLLSCVFVIGGAGALAAVHWWCVGPCSPYTSGGVGVTNSFLYDTNTCRHLHNPKT